MEVTRVGRLISAKVGCGTGVADGEVAWVDAGVLEERDGRRADEGSVSEVREETGRTGSGSSANDCVEVNSEAAMACGWRLACEGASWREFEG